MCSWLHIAFFFFPFNLTIYLGDFSKSVHTEEPHFYSTETWFSAVVRSHDLTGPPSKGSLLAFSCTNDTELNNS